MIGKIFIQPSPLTGEGARRAGEGALGHEPLSHHCSAMVPHLPQGERVDQFFRLFSRELMEELFLLPWREKVAPWGRMRGNPE